MQNECGSRYFVDGELLTCVQVEPHAIHTGSMRGFGYQWADKDAAKPVAVSEQLPNDDELPPDAAALVSFFPPSGARCGVRGRDVELDDCLWGRVLVVDNHVEAIELRIETSRGHELAIIPWSSTFVVTQYVDDLDD